jgi:hypothetical protein
MRKIRDKLAGLASGAGILVLFLLAHTVLLLMMLFTFPRINATLGNQAFDLQTFGYTVSTAMEMLQQLDQATIDLYLFPQLWLLDVLYPLLLALFLSTCIIRLSDLLKTGRRGILSGLFLLPFIAMVFDYFENILISLMISHGSTVSAGVIRTASIFTLMKGLLTMLSWLVILVLLSVWLIHKRQMKRAAGPT